MRTWIVYILTISVILISQAGCSTDSPPEPTTYGLNRCFTIIDSQTKEPVEGALMRLTYDTNVDTPLGSGVGSFEGLTDSNGSICSNIKSGATCTSWQVFGNQYKPICHSHALSFPPDVIEMEFECYLRFEIKNEEPFSQVDNIRLTYQDILECGSQNSVSLNGADIDTTIVRRADPKSPLKISLESSGANPFNRNIRVIVRSRDTTLVQIVY